MPKRKYFTLLEKNAARSEAARKRLMNDDLLRKRKNEKLRETRAANILLKNQSPGASTSSILPVQPRISEIPMNKSRGKP